MGQGTFAQREAFGVRAACCRCGTVLQHRKRQQAARPPNASRPGAFRPYRHTSLDLCRRALRLRGIFLIPPQGSLLWESVVRLEWGAVVVAGTARVNSSGSGGVPALRVVYKGCTPDAQGLYKLLKREHPLSIPCTPLVHPLYTAFV